MHRSCSGSEGQDCAGASPSQKSFLPSSGGIRFEAQPRSSGSFLYPYPGICEVKCCLLLLYAEYAEGEYGERNVAAVVHHSSQSSLSAPTRYRQWILTHNMSLKIVDADEALFVSSCYKSSKRGINCVIGQGSPRRLTKQSGGIFAYSVPCIMSRRPINSII